MGLVTSRATPPTRDGLIPPGPGLPVGKRTLSPELRAPWNSTHGV